MMFSEIHYDRFQIPLFFKRAVCIENLANTSNDFDKIYTIGVFGT